ELLHNQTIEVEVTTAGGTGTSTMSRITGEALDLGTMRRIVAKHIESMNADNAAPVSYTAVEIKALKPTKKMRELAAYAKKLDLAIDHYEHAVAILDPANADRQNALTYDELKYYYSVALESARQIESIRAKTEACQDDVKNCQASAINVAEVTWPQRGC